MNPFTITSIPSQALKLLFDEARVDIRSNSMTIPRLLDMDFSQDNLYLVTGYNF